MLKEIRRRREDSNEKNRRWFQDPDMSLFVWTNEEHIISRFQLIYVAFGSERTLEWSLGNDIRNYDSETFRYGSAVLAKETTFDLAIIRKNFEALSVNIDSRLRAFILLKLSPELEQHNEAISNYLQSRLDWSFSLILFSIMLCGIAFIYFLSAN